MKILIINGPNLNMVGIREPQLYGSRTYENLVASIETWARELSLEVEIYQSNHEGEIVTKIQEAYQVFDGIVINAAAYTHTSVAILDALKAVAIPTVEVHLTDINSREPFRKVSYVSMAAERTICGKGFEGYHEALSYLVEKY
ncbi:MAG: type II 3-dehydroquinate dehydratase [Firmicutes bacterium]|nr:type II 3-dehydroquinate dehydratase [Bacillota bacterium]